MKIFEFKSILPRLPSLLFRGRLRFDFEMLPFEARHIPWKKKWNFVVAGMNQFFLPSRPWGYPVIAQVEPSNICNLSCPLCLTANLTPSRPHAFLSFDRFKQFIDEVGDYLLLIVLWNWGEPFLNPDIYKIIQYAAARNILVHSSTNGNVKFDDEAADKIVDSGLSSLVFGVDGADPEVYRSYRKGGDLERVKENIRTLVRAKKRKSSASPMLTLRFVAMKQNEAQLPLVEKMAQELGVDFFAIKSVDTPGELGTDLDKTYRPEEEKYRRYDYMKGTFIRVKKPFECMRPWKRITIDALGEVISCEYDYKNLHSFGNIGNNPGNGNHNASLGAWKSRVSRLFRREFHKGHNEFYHCKTCSYKDLRTETCILDARPVAGAGKKPLPPRNVIGSKRTKT